MEHCPYVLDRTGRDIHAEAANLRASGPITLVGLPGGYTAWSVTGYELAKQLLVDPRISKNTKAHWPAFRDGEVPQEWELYSWVVMDNMQTRDGVEHDRLRKLVAPAFTARQVAKSKPVIEGIVGRLLDNLASAPAGEPVDIKGEYFYPLAATLICDLFGVPEGERQAVLRSSVVNGKTTNSTDEAEANLHDWQNTLTELVESKRRTPGDDLTSVVLSAREDEHAPLTDEEVVGTLFLMFGGGTETVGNVLTHAVIDLLTHPDQLALVRSGASDWNAVFQETLRKEAAVAQLPFRCATEDFEAGGVSIAKGDLVLIAYAGAGRDPELHGETAAEFDITRTDKTNISFGYGPHRCLGPSLANMQATVALPALFDRFPDLRLAVPVEELKPQGTFIFNGYAEVPLLLKD